mmetsp:Transcript_13898/g.28716  ORF Transcript_13898/g.28716 Transcript_13898/m.28716 type:complete len:324 (-) Transcript_13898:467-1438(-)
MTLASCAVQRRPVVVVCLVDGDAVFTQQHPDDGEVTVHAGPHRRGVSVLVSRAWICAGDQQELRVVDIPDRGGFSEGGFAALIFGALVVDVFDTRAIEERLDLLHCLCLGVCFRLRARCGCTSCGGATWRGDTGAELEEHFLVENGEVELRGEALRGCVFEQHLKPPRRRDVLPRQLLADLLDVKLSQQPRKLNVHRCLPSPSSARRVLWRTSCRLGGGNTGVGSECSILRSRCSAAHRLQHLYQLVDHTLRRRAIPRFRFLRALGRAGRPRLEPWDVGVGAIQSHASGIFFIAMAHLDDTESLVFVVVQIQHETELCFSTKW